MPRRRVVAGGGLGGGWWTEEIRGWRACLKAQKTNAKLDFEKFTPQDEITVPNKTSMSHQTHRGELDNDATMRARSNIFEIIRQRHKT